MCKRCETYFTIHNVDELKSYLKSAINWGIEKDLLYVWLTRGYITNLLYLEYLEDKNLNR
jgi:hypothetical protein